MNDAAVRQKMIRDQILPRGIAEPRVIEAMSKVPRHLFVEEALRGVAYGDHPLPIGESQTISQPYTVARMTEALELKGEERVLEIGTGSGYQTAILAELCRKVYSVELCKSLAVKARNLLERLGYINTVIRIVDGSHGWKEEAPFDRILVTAAFPEIPAALIGQLDKGGKMVVPIGKEDSQTLFLARSEGGAVQTRSLGDCSFVIRGDRNIGPKGIPVRKLRLGN